MENDLDALFDAFAKKAEEERLLLGIWVGFVVGHEGVVAEQLSPRAQNPTCRREEFELLGRNVVCRQPTLPGLCPALGVMDELRLLRETVEVVPLMLKEPDIRSVLFLESDPVSVVEGSFKELVELRAHFPVRELSAVESGIEIDCLLPDGSDTCIEFEGDETGASFEVSWLFWSEGAALPHYEGIGDRLLEEFQCLR